MYKYIYIIYVYVYIIYIVCVSNVTTKEEGHAEVGDKVCHVFFGGGGGGVIHAMEASAHRHNTHTHQTLPPTHNPTKQIIFAFLPGEASTSSSSSTSTRSTALAELEGDRLREFRRALPLFFPRDASEAAAASAAAAAAAAAGPEGAAQGGACFNEWGERVLDARRIRCVGFCSTVVSGCVCVDCFLLFFAAACCCYNLSCIKSVSRRALPC